MSEKNSSRRPSQEGPNASYADVPSPPRAELNEHSLAHFFSEVDGPYVSTRPAGGEQKLTWKCSNMPVRNGFKLPIPVDLAGTVVEYKFNTHDYDIGFSVEFQTINEEGERQLDVILVPERYDSHIEPFVQQVQLEQPGTLILVWDNSYSWWYEKQLSYSVTLQAPSVSGFEKARCERALSYFNGCLEALRGASQKRLHCKSMKTQLSTELSDLTLKIEQLNLQLSEKTNELEKVIEEDEMLQQKIDSCKQKITGFTFRLFPAPILSCILSYMDVRTDEWALVCRDWAYFIKALATSTEQS